MSVKRFLFLGLSSLVWAALLGATVARGQVVVQGPAITIGYTNCLAVAGYSQALMNAVTNYNWYFASASVGSLMCEGLTNLHLADPSFYQLQSLSSGGSPPATTAPGNIYVDDRGHSTTNNYYGDWQYEVGYFQTAAGNGWTYPRVDIAMNILSFIDIWYNNSSTGVTAELDGYIGSMTNLEAAYPQTLFVYMTMPITTTNYSYEADTEPEDEYWRCVFNNQLRAWCAANNRVLFDIADIEAHDTNGNLVTFTYDGLLCEQLYSGDNQGGDAGGGEVGDGAHPTNFAAEELIAKGFYALVAALLDRVESRPPPPATFQFLSLSNGIATIGYSGVPNTNFLVQRSTNLAGSWFTLGSTTTPASGSFQWTDNFHDLGATPRAAFYRLQQQ
jgi:hypothetical protein